MNRRYKKIVNTFLISLLFVIAAVIRVAEVPRVLWFDENISISTLSINPFNNPLYTGVTTNLPLYFWVISFLNLIFHPQNVKLLRLLGVALSIVNALILYKFAFKKYPAGTSVILLLIFLFAPIQIHYSAELRPYVLCEFLATMLFVLYESDLSNRRNLVLINLITILGLLTHYSFYIFYMGLTLWAIFRIQSINKLLTLSLLPVLTGILVIYTYFNNPLFIQSMNGQELSKSESVFSGTLISYTSLERLKEVVSQYYYFGLYYYRVDAPVQFILKKLLLILAFTGFIYARKTKILSAVIPLIVCLLISLTAEYFGYYPFGGRHIMPFSFLLYIVVAAGLSQVSKLRRFGYLFVTFVTGCLVLSFFIFQGCSQIFRERYTGTGDPQGDLYNYCIVRLMNP